MMLHNGHLVAALIFALAVTLTLIQPALGIWTSRLLLDAGSSGTKLKSYEYKYKTGDALPTITLNETHKFKPGIHTFKNNPHGLKEYLAKILNTAKQNNRNNKLISSIEIYLYATAGMRSLSKYDRKHLIFSITSKLSKLAKPFKFTDRNVKVISGAEEGAFMWVAANYLNGYIGSKYDKKKKSAGTIEIGGLSTQITFEAGEEYIKDGIFDQRVGDQKYFLYSHSYLNYGVNGIEQQIVDGLLTESNNATSVTNPCMVKKDTKVMRNVTFQGSGDPDICQAKLDVLVKPAPKCKTCAIGKVYQPPLPADTVFYALGVPFSLFKDKDKDELDVGAFETRAKSHCQKSLSTLKSQGKSTMYASSDCLMGLYVPALLTKGLHFPRNTRNVKAVKGLDRPNGRPMSVDWSLGALLVDLTRTKAPKRR